MNKNTVFMKRVSVILLFTVIFSIVELAGKSASASSFKPYKAAVTTSRLNIRTGPSTRYRLLGSYSKGQVIDVIGKSGSYLRTSRGYVYAGYTRAVTSAPQISRGVVVAPFKVVIDTVKLNIRSLPSAAGRIVGTYSMGSIVDVFGQQGSYLKTQRGYIWAAYTRKYSPPNPEIKPVTINNTGKYVRVKANTQILISPGGSKDERFAAGGRVFKILEHRENYYKIRMGSFLGYIPETSGEVLDTYSGKVTLGWQYVYNKSANRQYYDDSGDFVNKNSGSLGLDVLSPTWFAMDGGTDPAGIRVVEKADREYTRLAHRNGYEVWGLVSEFNADRAYSMMASTEARERVISQIAQYAIDYNLDGVNIDFEALGIKNKDLFTAFVRDLSSRLKQRNIIVSIDVTKPTPFTSNVWSAGYDRKALSDFVDYMMLMAYDESYAGASRAGSVGSYPWVKAGVDDMLTQGVSRDKLILGVPFYLRDFAAKEVNLPYDSIAFNSNSGGVFSQPSTDNIYKLEAASIGKAFKYLYQIPGYYVVEYSNESGQAYIPMTNTDYLTENVSRDYVVSSEAISLQTTTNRISENNGSVYYDEAARQSVAQYYKNGLKHLVWLEDSQSMNWRIDIVKDYNLPGMAAWSLNWSVPENVWNVIRTRLK